MEGGYVKLAYCHIIVGGNGDVDVLIVAACELMCGNRLDCSSLIQYEDLKGKRDGAYCMDLGVFESDDHNFPVVEDEQTKHFAPG